jgi:hypothetical protein
VKRLVGKAKYYFLRLLGEVLILLLSQASGYKNCYVKGRIQEQTSVAGPFLEETDIAYILLIRVTGLFDTQDGLLGTLWPQPLLGEKPLYLAR